MKFAIINGSHRAEAQSLKVARYIERVILRDHPAARVFFYSLSGNPLPLWDEQYGGAPPELWNPIAAELQSSDAIVIVTPEWNGMATSGIKNFLHFCSVDDVGHKPGLIVTVSASRNGAYPVAELRMNGTKNNRMCFIPEHIIVRDAETMLNSEEADKTHRADGYLRRRLAYALRLLEKYGEALKLVRASGVIDHEAFPSGM